MREQETFEIYAEKKGNEVVIKSRGQCTEIFFYAVIAKVLQEAEKGAFKDED